MDSRLIDLYEQELRHLGETADEFGRAFPAKARALALGEEPPDPYVERLLEGVAFVAARVRLKLEAQFPQFTQSLLETVYPDFLAPVPSLAIFRLQAETPPPPSGLVVKQGSRVQGQPARDRAGSVQGEPTACVFSLAHDVRLLPVRLVEAEWLVRRLHECALPPAWKGGAALRLRFQKTDPAPWKEISLDPLVVHVPACKGLGYEILEQLFFRQVGLVVRSRQNDISRTVFQQKGQWVRKFGFEPEMALLPSSSRTFEGHRLLREYFAMPDRFLFFELRDFQEALAACPGETLELIIALSETGGSLEREVRASHFELFCAPAANLFEKHFAQVIEPERYSEFQVVPDANRPLDFEVHSITSVVGYSEKFAQGRPFQAFFQKRYRERERSAFYTVIRQPRMCPEETRSEGAAAYPGSDVFLALVDAEHAPLAEEMNQLVMTARCTNRHLPILLKEGKGVWSLEGGIKARVEVLLGPTTPDFQPVDGRQAWQLINLFSLNYLSLVDEAEGGAAALRELLSLYAGRNADWAARQVAALRSIRANPVSRPLYYEPRPGQPRRITALVRGLELTLEFEETAFRDLGIILLGGVLEEFFARYVSLNSFTETLVRSWPDGRERMHWPARSGLKPPA